jgi:cytochrome c oxidase assembly protein subunit 15
MTPIQRRVSRLRKMAWLCAALVLAITSLSAFIRLSRAGLGCEPWPQCYSQGRHAAQDGVTQPSSKPVLLARTTHRVVAVLALLLVIAMLMTALASEPMLWRQGRMVLGLLALALFLAILGRWTTSARVPAVMLGNLLAGFAMFALSWQLALAAAQQPPVSAAQQRLARWAWLGLALLGTQVVLGGLLSAGHAGLSCPQLTGCDTSGASWQALNPWHETSFDPADDTGRAGALIHLLHRGGAVVLAAVLLPLGVAAWRRGLRAGPALLLLLALQAALGAALVLGALPLAVALAHNVVAALLVAVLPMLALAGRRPG